MIQYQYDWFNIPIAHSASVSNPTRRQAPLSLNNPSWTSIEQNYHNLITRYTVMNYDTQTMQFFRQELFCMLAIEANYSKDWLPYSKKIYCRIYKLSHFPRPNISKTNRLKLCSGHSVEAPNLALFQPLGWKRWKGVIQEELKPNNTYLFYKIPINYRIMKYKIWIWISYGQKGDLRKAEPQNKYLEKNTLSISPCENLSLGEFFSHF